SPGCIGSETASGGTKATAPAVAAPHRATSGTGARRQGSRSGNQCAGPAGRLPARGTRMSARRTLAVMLAVPAAALGTLLAPAPASAAQGGGEEQIDVR